jgi:hypothetical protein
VALQAPDSVSLLTFLHALRRCFFLHASTVASPHAASRSSTVSPVFAVVVRDDTDGLKQLLERQEVKAVLT